MSRIDYEDEDTFKDFTKEQKVCILESKQKEQKIRNEIDILQDLFQKNCSIQMSRRWLFISKVYSELGFSDALTEIEKEINFA